jgi:hypothetical protein
MTLTHKKYWLDGIFEEDLSSKICVPDTCISTPLNEEVCEKEIFAQWWSSEEILCREFIHCDNVNCGKRHYYNIKHKTRMYYRNFAKIEVISRDALNRAIDRLAGQGVLAIVR